MNSDYIYLSLISYIFSGQETSSYLIVLFATRTSIFYPPGQRYRIFLFPGKSLTFAIFGQKSSVSETVVFFFSSAVFFFRLLNLSE